MTLAENWKSLFFDTIQSATFAEELKNASMNSELGTWTTLLTRGVVTVCQNIGWESAAKGHRYTTMPEPKEEYLGIDVMAFEPNKKHWKFPKAAIELENSTNDERISYSLWKVLNLNADLRIVFCYRPESSQGTRLVKYLAKSVVSSMEINHRFELIGETLVVVGYRDRTETFPYSFFKWWLLNRNTGHFEQF